MSFIRNANPDATNSELDAKKIVHNVTFDDYKFADEIDDPLDNITQEIKEQVIEQYVELVVDNMDTKDLVRYAQEQLTDYFNKLSDSEIKEDIDCYNDELYSELVDNVTNETVLDINNNGGKF